MISSHGKNKILSIITSPLVYQHYFFFTNFFNGSVKICLYLIIFNAIFNVRFTQYLTDFLISPYRTTMVTFAFALKHSMLHRLQNYRHQLLIYFAMHRDEVHHSNVCLRQVFTWNSICLGFHKTL